MNAALLLLSLSTHWLPAPQVAVVGRRAIDWGRLVPGVESTVDPHDAARRGEIAIVDAGARDLIVSLPTHLVSERGDRIPVTFRQGEVLLVYPGTGFHSAPDPREPIAINPAPESDNVTLFLGGTARPAPLQPPGDYRAVVTVASRVAMSPGSVYISNGERAAALELYNSDNTPTEIEFSFAFGYPISDSPGKLEVPITAFPPAGKPSAPDWLRIHPRRLVLQPGQRQLVRIAAYPSQLPDGDYWARLIVRSRPLSHPLTNNGGAVPHERGAMQVEAQFVTAVNHGIGSENTSVEVERAEAQRTESTVALAPDLRRAGGDPYPGRLEVELVSPGGAVVERSTDLLAVYRSLRGVVTLGFPVLAHAGPVEIRYHPVTGRDDLPAGHLIRGVMREGWVPVAR